MMLDIWAIITFIVKVTLIEAVIELLRFATTAIWNSALPEYYLLDHDNRYFSWFLNGLESCVVMLLFYQEFSIAFIVFFALGLTFIVKQLGSLIIKNMGKA